MVSGAEKKRAIERILGSVLSRNVFAADDVDCLVEDAADSRCSVGHRCTEDIVDAGVASRGRMRRSKGEFWHFDFGVEGGIVLTIEKAMLLTWSSWYSNLGTQYAGQISWTGSTAARWKF